MGFGEYEGYESKVGLSWIYMCRIFDIFTPWGEHWGCEVYYFLNFVNLWGGLCPSYVNLWGVNLLIIYI